MLPTNEKANNSLKGYLDKSILFSYKKEYITIDSEKGITGYYHLSVLVDGKTNSGDWWYNIHDNKIGQYGNEQKNIPQSPYVKKIIATTDESLKLPKPSPAFIEKYVEEYNKGNQITEVMVEYESVEYTRSMPMIHQKYYVDQLKVNKDNTITIKKVKDSWTREEVIRLLTKAIKDCEEYELFNHWNGEYRNLDKWIEENI